MHRNIIFLIGVVVGAVGMAGLKSAPRQAIWSYAFVVQNNDQGAMAVKPDGKIEFGPAYTADTLRQLLDGLKKMREPGYRQADCHETGYRFLFGDDAKNGVIRIYPGIAPPPTLPRLASDL